jgi:cytosine/adenosine deaminase-related metal-dependent hydrolase
MESLVGRILLEDGFHQGNISFDTKNKPSIHIDSNSRKQDSQPIIIPPFVNAHTHIGDSFIRKMNIPLPRDVKSLVGPPNGLKHTLLRTTDEKMIQQGMKDAIEEMNACGTSTFVDFREEGFAGAKMVHVVSKDLNVRPIIYGRPENLSYDHKELLMLFKIVDGIGISSISDWSVDHLDSIVSLAQRCNIPIAMHACETKREDIDKILSYEPAFLVHMTTADKQDLKMVKQQNIPIVICPRSNAYYGLKTPLKKMKELQITLLLGTDNAMLHSPCVLDEIKFILKRFPGVFTKEELLLMATYEARKALNLKDGIPGANFPASRVVLDQGSLQLISTSVGC